MKILIACEESGIVTKAFRDKGHEAYSCDILPTSGEHSEWHFQQDVTELLKQDWDMCIAFPPCTHLAISGSRHFKQKQKDGRQDQGIEFFKLFTNLTHISKVAIENPVGIMSTLYKKPSQIINPYEFGHPTSKKTCLWLKGLPLLYPTNRVKCKKVIVNGNKYDAWWYESCSLPQELRSVFRSKTFEGIALAMAEQWG